MKTLSAYFSHAGENYAVGNIKKGNTEIVAEVIAKLAESDLFKIETKIPYSSEYSKCVKLSKNELKENARPELLTLPTDLSDYDVIFLGYPNWCGEAPMAIFTFLESCDLKGKTIAPFCTHEGSGISKTIKRISDACPDLHIAPGLAIRGKTAQNSPDETEKAVAEWLRENQFI